MAQTNSEASKRRGLQLTLEEKVWFDRRQNDIQQYASIGGLLGAMSGATITSFGPFPRRVQAAAIIGLAIVGGGSGYLWADSKALDRVQDLSAASTLRKQYQQLLMEKKASKKPQDETPVQRIAMPDKTKRDDE